MLKDINFNALFACFAAGSGLERIKYITENLVDVLGHLERDYLRDKDAKNAALDAICEILQAHKDPIDNK